MINHTIQPENVKRFVNLNHPEGFKEFYSIFNIDTEKPLWVLTRYKSQRNLVKGLAHHGLFPIHEDINSLLSKGIGWLSWSQLKLILEKTREQFRTQAKRKFVEDLIAYLDCRIREVDRIRNGRKQMSFW